VNVQSGIPTEPSEEALQRTPDLAVKPSDRPGICFVADHYTTPSAGTEGQLLSLVHRLSEEGWPVRLAVFRKSPYLESGAFPAPVDILGVEKIRSPGDWLKLARYLRRVRGEGFEIAHAFFNDASVMVPPLARLAGMASVISRRDMGFWYTPLLKRLLRFTGRFVTACICNSGAVKTLTLSEEGLPASRIRVIYNGYVPYHQTEEVSSLKKVNGANQVVGIVANLRRIKRLDTLIRAIEVLRARNYPVEAHFVGGPGDDPDLPALAEALGVAESCRFWGSQPDPSAYITGFDVAVLCSESEGFSNAIIEYMQHGKPVVCTRTGGNPEIVADGVNGYLFEVGDFQALAERIAHLLDKPELRTRMGKANRELVEERYSLDTMIKEHELLYSELRQPC